MEVFKAIATYLIEKRVTSSQSMARWFLPLCSQFNASFAEAVRSGEYQQYIRALYEEKIINSEITSYLLQVSLWLEEAKEKVRILEEQGISVLLFCDFGYPIEFAEIADKPTILFCYGNLTLLASPDKVTLVGTRLPSKWGETKAKQLAYEAAKCGIVTVSGMATGIDTFVLQETLKFGGNTIAILPQLEMQFISENPDKILYLSEYPPSTKEISKWQFVARNRLLAALSPYTVLVEAPIRSGTLITADLAISYGKTVYVVIPDPYEDSAYGGLAFGVQQIVGCFIQSLYDVFYFESQAGNLENYKKMIAELSNFRIVIKEKDNRHLAQADLSRYLHASSLGDLAMLDTYVVELHRFGIIRERKNKMVFNFSGYNSWPKI